MLINKDTLKYHESLIALEKIGILNEIKKVDNPVICEIGGGYGGLASKIKSNVKGAKISQIYRRLDPNKPSYTVTGTGGGGTHVYHW